MGGERFRQLGLIVAVDNVVGCAVAPPDFRFTDDVEQNRRAGKHGFIHLVFSLVKVDVEVRRVRSTSRVRIGAGMRAKD